MYRPSHTKCMRRSFCLYSLLTISFIVYLLSFIYIPINSAFAHPHYNVNSQKIVLRGAFSTNYSSSSNERKHNIYLATKSLNNSIIYPHEMLSFNEVVGERIASRGYKNAKIISNGKFIDGVGGGVCQVSTTLYNASLLCGLNILEYHPHTLQVNYIEPSFDAMVNSYYADLKIENITLSPVIIKATADGQKVKIKVYGEPLNYQIELKSEVYDVITPKSPIIKEIDQLDPLYNELEDDQNKTIIYAKNGIKSKGYLIKKDNKGKIIENTLLRKDYYKEVQEIIVKRKEKAIQDV